MKITDLKPCPFCGSDRITVWNIRDGQQAVCKECKSTGTPTFHGKDGREATWAHAAEAWNRRAPLPEEAASDDVIGYVLRYGGMCRDCADMDGVCQSGQPCDTDQRRAVVKHTISALAYGIEHGFIANPFTAALAVQTQQGVEELRRLDDALGNFINAYGDPYEPAEDYEAETERNIKELSDAYNGAYVAGVFSDRSALVDVPAVESEPVAKPDWWQDEEAAEREFTEYFVRNYPGPDTIIHDPNWHAPKLFRAAKRALLATALSTRKGSAGDGATTITKDADHG